MDKDSIRKRNANLSYLLPLITFLTMGFVMKLYGSASSTSSLIIGGVYFLLLLIAAVLSIMSIASFIKLKSKSILLKGIAGLLLNSLIFLIMISTIFGSANRSMKKIEVLKKEIDKTDEMYPVLANKDTRIDTVYLGDDKRVYQQLTMVNFLVSEIDTAQFRTMLSQQLINDYNTTDTYDFIKNSGLPFTVFFNDKNGSRLCEISIEPQS